jgi:hypothetical protein
MEPKGVAGRTTHSCLDTDWDADLHIVAAMLKQTPEIG